MFLHGFGVELFHRRRASEDRALRVQPGVHHEEILEDVVRRRLFVVHSVRRVVFGCRFERVFTTQRVADASSVASGQTRAYFTSESHIQTHRARVHGGLLVDGAHEIRYDDGALRALDGVYLARAW